MRCIITGNAGFIGSHLVDKLISEGHEVVGYDNLRSGRIDNVNKDCNFVRGDILNYSRLKRSMRGCDTVFHLAAIPRVLYSVEHPVETHETNVTGTLNVLLAAKETGVKKVIFASSSSVNGSNVPLPTDENQKHAPESPYAAHKAIGEVYMSVFNNLYGIDMIACRFYNVYGVRCTADNPYSLVIGKFTHLMSQNKPIEVYGNGKSERDFTYVSDAVDGMYRCSQLSGYQVVNIGNGNPVSVNKIVELLKQYYPDSVVNNVDAKLGEVRKTHADNTKAKKLLGWRPKVNIEQGIKQYVDWYTRTQSQV